MDVIDADSKMKPYDDFFKDFNQKIQTLFENPEDSLQKDNAELSKSNNEN